MSRPKIGDLRHRVTLLSVGASPDGAGGFSEQWSEVATVWAGIAPITGRERWQAQQVSPSATTEITLRWRSGVTPSMRISSEGITYGILDVQAMGGEKRFLLCLCEVLANA
jgi:SPP1 family predicted phage head-tail adaptor